MIFPLSCQEVTNHNGRILRVSAQAKVETKVVAADPINKSSNPNCWKLNKFQIQKIGIVPNSSPAQLSAGGFH